MHNSMKIAISIPKEDFLKIEKFRKKFKEARSVFVDRAVKFWVEHLEQKELVERYENGYRKHPESISEIKAIEALSAETFKEEALG
ncbi:MAG: hypothetical protein AAB213_02250 [Candidatus Omnitrophota bacterium]